jgi:hypothetical protein
MTNATIKIIAGFGMAAILITALAACSGPRGSTADGLADGPSDGAMFIYDGTDSLVAPGTKLAWNADAFANANKTGDYVEFLCPNTSTGGFSFISEPGNERSPKEWKLNSQLGFKPGTQSLLAPVLTPDWLINGDFAQVKAKGGNYSLGFACVENNGLTVSRVFFRHITVTAGTGDWTVDTNN